MRKIILALAATALMAGPALAREECTSINEDQVAQLFERWNASLATLKPDEVVKNYAEDAVLLPTLSNTPRLTQDERKEYFVEFLAKKPQGEIDTRVIKVDCNTAIDTGTYTFTLADGKKVPARYTYTYAAKDGNWLISSHHSSAMPETVK